MIRIRLDEQGFTVQGHAGAAPAGQDTVCAAVSALAYTLALNVRAEGHVEEGDTVIRWKALSEGERAVVEAVGRTCARFAEEYPRCIAFEWDAETGVRIATPVTSVTGSQ